MENGKWPTTIECEFAIANEKSVATNAFIYKEQIKCFVVVWGTNFLWGYFGNGDCVCVCVCLHTANDENMNKR